MLPRLLPLPLLRPCEMQLGAGILLAQAGTVNRIRRRTGGEEAPAWESQVLPLWRVVLEARRHRSRLTLPLPCLCQTPALSPAEAATEGMDGEDLVSLGFLASVGQRGVKPQRVWLTLSREPEECRWSEISS